MWTLTQVWPLVLAVIPIAVGCQDLPTQDRESTEAATAEVVAAVAGGPVTISRGEGEWPISGFTTTGCSGEWFAVNGKVTYRYQITQHPSGDWMLSQHEVYRLEGAETVTGQKYLGIGNFNTTQIFAAPNGGAFTYSSKGRLLGITQGASDNSAFVVHGKWTIDGSGKVAVESFRVEWECRG